MKWIAFLLLVAGVGLAAAVGARNTPDMLAAQQRDQSHRAYCDQRDAEKLTGSPECENAGWNRKKATHWKAVVLQSHDPAERLATGKSTLKELVNSGENIRGTLGDPSLGQKRRAWIDALAVSIQDDPSTWDTPKPGARLITWMRAHGFLFAVGLVLIVCGGLLTRKISRKEATAQGAADTKNASVEAVDFEALLKTLNEETVALHAALAAKSSPQDNDFEEAKSSIEALQEERVERLVDARINLQVRYGIGGFAQIFGPMAAGERNLNRAWSAMVDNHWPEALASVEYAASQFEESCKQFESVRQAQA